MQARNLEVFNSGHQLKQTHMCPICGKQFERNDGLMIHMSKMHPYDETETLLNLCHICGKTYKGHPNVLVQHIQRIHVNPTTKKAKKRHSNIDRSDLKFPCSICGKKFETKALLDQHSKTHEEKAHRCDWCDRRFTFKNTLLVHMKTCKQNNL